MERPGQHRGVPAFKSTLGLGSVHRRWREAVVASAETIADISLIAQTQGAPDDGPDEFAPFGAIEWQKRMMMMLPMGWNVMQPQGSQPPANYEMYMKSHIQELARPRAMPYNLAAADNSGNSFASGKLDLFPYYMVVDDSDREDCNDLVLDKVFAIWWQEYVLVKQTQQQMLDADPLEPPDHAWDWPRNPIADEASEVRTNAEKLRTGQAAPSDIAHDNGQSFEDVLRRMARDWGKTTDEVREALFTVSIAPKSGGMLEGGGPVSGGDGGDEDDSPLSRVLQYVSGGKPPAPVQNRQQPEQNGKDAPTLEQMSMLVGALVQKFDAILARLDAGKESIQ
jgi:capsid protein